LQITDDRVYTILI